MILASEVLEFCTCKYTYAQDSFKFSAYSIKINAHIAMVIYLAETALPSIMSTSMFCSLGENATSWFSLDAFPLWSANAWWSKTGTCKGCVCQKEN